MTHTASPITPSTASAPPAANEITTGPNGLPLRLSFTPNAIREHFEDDPDFGALVEARTDEQLAAIGEDALCNDFLYRVFHEVLVAALTGADKD